MKSNFLRRIPEEAWSAILRKIDELNISLSTEILESLSLGKWDHPIFDTADWIYIAFHAYLEGKWDIDTMCKLFLYDACQKQAQKDQKIARTYQLINGQGKINRRALALLTRATDGYLSAEELVQTFSQMAPEKSQFFALEDPQDALFDFITNPNTPGAPHWTLLTVRIRRVLWQIVASPDFIYALHRAKFGENAIRPIPILGYSQTEKLSDPEARVVAIPSMVALPEQVHNLSCNPLGMYHHDIVYHHALESANIHRPVWIQFAHFLKEKGQEWMFPIALDRELISYIRTPRENPPENFWIGLDCQFLLFLVSPKPKTSDLSLLDRVILLTDSFTDLCTQFYREYGAQLEEQYGLTLSSLANTLEAPAPWQALPALRNLSLRQSLYMRLEKLGGEI